MLEILNRVLTPDEGDVAGYVASGAIRHPEWRNQRIDFQPYPFPTYTEELVRLLKETHVEGDRAFLAQDASAISVSRQPVEVNRKLAWREGKVILKNQTLDDAVADFNRYSPKTIVIVDATLRDKRLFGQYKLDAPELFAQDVSTVLDVPVAITADTIFIGRRQGEAQDGI